MRTRAAPRVIPAMAGELMGVSCENTVMSPRKNYRSKDARPENSEGSDREPRPSNEWEEDGFTVRALTGASSTKVYRCPGCDHEIRMATPHIVAWPTEDPETRRHWHTPCWNSRSKRAPKIERTRNAPRY